MAEFSVYTVEDLSGFSGRPAVEYTNSAFAKTAVLQATLLFKLGTCLRSIPDDPIQAELAEMAILAMADSIYLAQPFQAILANPFSSETIGSYSYSKVAGAVAGGLPTGITWFDLAVSQMSVCDLDLVTGGGIEVFEHDGILVGGSNGNRRLLSPQDLDLFRSWGHDPAPAYAGVPTSPSDSSSDDVDPDGGTFHGGGTDLDGGHF